MRGYKHIAAAHADGLLSGISIQIATFEYYRKMDWDRSDKYEGMLTYQAPNIRDAKFNQVERDAANKTGAFLFTKNSGGIASLGECKISAPSPAHYIFCCSSEPDQSRRAIGERIIEIADLETFASLIGKSFPKVLGASRVGPVKYGDRVGRGAEHFLGMGDGVFEKPEHLARERELRVAWRVISFAENVIRASISPPGGLMREV